MLKIKLAGFFLKLGAFFFIVTIEFGAGFTGGFIAYQIAKLIFGDIPTRDMAPWGGLLIIGAFAGSFFLTAYLLGGSRSFGSTFHDIDRWIDSCKPHLIKWSHNGVVAVVCARDFDHARKLVESKGTPSDKMVFAKAQNIMTFSDNQSNGKVTGTINDLKKLERGCRVMWCPLFVPGVSGKEIFPVVSLCDAHKLVHGKAC